MHEERLLEEREENEGQLPRGTKVDRQQVRLQNERNEQLRKSTKNIIARIGTDRVDAIAVDKPHRWNIKFIKWFMITFGLLSCVFDCLTFSILLFLMKEDEKVFQTGWFVESVISATLIVLLVRTRLTFFKSLPDKYLSNHQRCGAVCAGTTANAFCWSIWLCAVDAFVLWVDAAYCVGLRFLGRKSQTMD